MQNESLLQSYESEQLNDYEVLANLPEQFAEKYGRAISVRGLLSLIDNHGGRSIYVPRTPGDDHHLSTLLSNADLSVLRQLYGGGRVTGIPSAAQLRRYLRDKNIISLRETGHSVRQVAEKVGVTERWVQKVTARHRACEPSQAGEH
jgi:Mor family transcriptional regulator